MTQFWPRRPDPKGFSIERLAKGYREKISKNSNKKPLSSFSDKKIITLKSKLIDRNTEDIKNSKEGYIHWANRDFLEYKDAA